MIADDHPIVRDALKNILVGHNLLVVAEAESGPDTLEMLKHTECDLLLLDMGMPGYPVGPELIKAIVQGENPPPILVFSMSDDGQLASEALQMGASGYLTKDSDPDVILEAIAKVAAKGKYISTLVAEKILFGDKKTLTADPPHTKLSRREHQIFLMLLDGKSMDSIATELCISRQTVGTHKMRLMQKLQVENNIDIVRYAINHGLMSL